MNYYSLFLVSTNQLNNDDFPGMGHWLKKKFKIFITRFKDEITKYVLEIFILYTVYYIFTLIFSFFMKRNSSENNIFWVRIEEDRGLFMLREL